MGSVQQQVEVTEKKKNDFVGVDVRRLDVVPKVTGEAIYTRDMTRARVLVGKIKRSPHPHARILGIDTLHAKSIPGVRTVITGNDFPKSIEAETPPLARGEVLYHNQSVAAVAADSELIALRALDSLDVNYEPLPAVFDPVVAMSDTPPTVIHPVDDAKEGPNVSKHIRVRHGSSFTQVAKSADVIVENEYSSSVESHMQLEPLTFLAQPDIDGGVTIWGTTTGPHKIRVEVAAYLGISQDLVRANVPYLGGWFGSKEESHVAAICALLSIKSRRPVKLSLSREETMTATGVRHPSRIRVTDAVSFTGKIVGRKVIGIYDGGAYSSLGNEVLRNGVLTAISVYDIPNVEIDVYRVHTNRVPGTPKRDPMGYQMIWAVECQMDLIASRLKLNPVEFRLVNALRQGNKNALGEVMESIDPELCLSSVSAAIGLGDQRRQVGPWIQGKGVALAAKWALAGPHQAMVKVRNSGQVEVWASVVENGGGSTTGIAQIAASEFIIPIEDVVMMSLHYGADSLSTGVTTGASGARQLVHVGRAVQLACQDAKRQILEEASPRMGIPIEFLEVGGGRVYAAKDPNKSMGISDFFEHAHLFASSVYLRGEDGFVGFGLDSEKTGVLDPETGIVRGGRVSQYYSDSAQAAEVWVNTETGRVKVSKIVAAQDVGKAMNPQLVRRQIVGGVMIGLSAALSEEFILSDGKIANANLADYKVVSAVDAPEIEPMILEIPFKDGPFGAKEGGEGATLPTAPAIRNAIHDATGVWVNDLPMTPERILDALESAKANQGKF